jgi:hypothetical protein
MTYQDTRPARAARSADTDGKAVVGFVSGLVGLLFGNIILGPIAIVLGAMALRGGTGRRGRAALAIGLGVADLVLFAALAAHSAAGHGGVLWHVAGL